MEGERRREDQVRLGTGQGGGGERGMNWKSGPRGNLAATRYGGVSGSLLIPTIRLSLTSVTTTPSQEEWSGTTTLASLNPMMTGLMVSP